MLTIPFVTAGQPTDAPRPEAPPPTTPPTDAPLTDVPASGAALTDALLSGASPPDHSPTDASPAEHALALSSGEGASVAVLDKEESQEPASSGDAVTPRNTVRAVLRAVAIGLVTGVVASLVVPLWAALVVAGVVVAGLYVPWVRGVATAAGVVSVAAGCISVVYGQHVHRYLPGSNWPSSFTGAGDLIWLGVVFLLADAVISAFRLRIPRALGSRSLRSGRPAPATPETQGTESDGSVPAIPAAAVPPENDTDAGRHRGGRHRDRTFGKRRHGTGGRVGGQARQVTRAATRPRGRRRA